MKKFFISILAAIGIFGATSCSDMLETESSRQAFDPELDEKTDSIFYAFGVLQAMQQLADQYVFTGEMRGDLVRTTEYTDNNLRKLYNFTADATNKYDSAYVYYRVINNCNYYIAHRDTTLLTGSEKVVMNEYAAMEAFRAWAYLQLGRNYEKVPFFTEPLTSVSQIDSNKFPELTLSEIVDALAPELEKYKDYSVPTSVKDGQSIGSTNSGVSKSLTARLCYVPVAVVLGDLYLEAERFSDAARCYTSYLINNKKVTGAYTASPSMMDMTTAPSDFTMNSLYSKTSGVGDWSSFFANNPTKDIVTYIMMPVNKRQGVTTGIPEAFGYDYYASSRSKAKIDEIQIMPSTYYRSLSENADQYYWKYTSDGVSKREVSSYKLGDFRMDKILEEGTDEDSTKIWMTKYNYGNILLYRTSTVYLHLAEAFNRLGHPDAAFAILKEGINDRLLESDSVRRMQYITDETREMLTTTYPFLSDVNKDVFSVSSASPTTETNAGIHAHGAGVTFDGYYPGRSPYQFDTIVGLKLAEIAEKYNVTINYTKEDTINAMEDILCDEYALELAFEGTRFPDLCRLARHKNAAATYGATFGWQWLDKKLEAKNLSFSFEAQPEKVYLPFK